MQKLIKQKKEINNSINNAIIGLLFLNCIFCFVYHELIKK